jgi:NitT/TauT family transport system permease protein
MNPRHMNRRYAWLRQLIAFGILLLIWEAAGRADMLNPLFMPSPSRIGSALYELFSDGRIWPHLEATFTAALAGLVLGLVAGIMLGIVGAMVPLVAELLEPVMTLLNAIPRVILAPLFVIWLGIGLASKVVRHVYLPSVTAWILGNLKVAVGFAFTGAVVGEFVAATSGLGYLLSFAQSTYNSALMLALVLLIMVVVLLIFAIAGRLEKYLLRWH